MAHKKGSTGTKDRALKPVSIRIYILLETVSAWEGNMSPEALQQMLRFGPAATPFRILNGHMAFDSSRGSSPLKAEQASML